VAKKKSIIINNKDNVATALIDLKTGDFLEEEFNGQEDRGRFTHNQVW